MCWHWWKPPGRRSLPVKSIPWRPSIKIIRETVDARARDAESAQERPSGQPESKNFPAPLKFLRSAGRIAALPTAAVAIALAAGAILLLAAGFSPLTAYGAFGSVNNLAETLLKSTPLILIGCGLSVAFRSGMWNIGAEGQLYAGAVAATLAGTFFSGLPAVLLVPLVLISGMAGGAVWGGLAGFFKVRFGASEIVTTIMLNFLAIIATSYLVTGPMIEEVGKFPQTAQIAEAARLPRMLLPTRLHIGFILALVVAVAAYVLLFRSSRGYALRTVGISPDAARYAGINVGAGLLTAMAISGGAAGLAGAVEVSGLTLRLYQEISPGYGFDGIAVALLANNNPIGVIFTGILFGALRSGSEVMQMNAQVPSVLVSVIQGAVLLSAAAFGVFRITVTTADPHKE